MLRSFQSISVQTLIYESYAKYGTLTLGKIERLRIKHRLRVVQRLEDGVERNVIKSVLNDKYMHLDELQVVIYFINNSFYLKPFKLFIDEFFAGFTKFH